MIGGSNRVLRGGSWNNNGRNVRSANRNRNEPANRNDNIGFRLALARTKVDTPFDQIVIQSAVLWRQKENALRRVSRAGLESPSKLRLNVFLSFLYFNWSSILPVCTMLKLHYSHLLSRLPGPANGDRMVLVCLWIWITRGFGSAFAG